MATKRKISVRKVLQMVLTLIVAVCCIIAMVSASNIESEKTLKTLPLVHIKNDRKYHFIEQKKIMNLAIYDRNVDIVHTPVGKLDIKGIEDAIKGDPWVQDAQVYIDIDRVMHIFVTQRVPVARIFGKDGTSYYIDTSHHTMPLSESYTYYTQVVTNAPEMLDDSLGMSLRQQLVYLVKCIREDKFWNAQVSHIVMESPGMFELIPVLGDHKIVFGDTSGAKEKLENLTMFYKKVLNKIGWDKYDKLDVRFNNQVVASPSLPYTGPVDKAAKQMNWIRSIQETESKSGARTKTKSKPVVAAKKQEAPKPVAPAPKAEPKKQPATKSKPTAKPAAKKKKTESKPSKTTKDKNDKPKYIYQENKKK